MSFAIQPCARSLCFSCSPTASSDLTCSTWQRRSGARPGWAPVISSTATATACADQAAASGPAVLGKDYTSLQPKGSGHGTVLSCSGLPCPVALKLAASARSRRLYVGSGLTVLQTILWQAWLRQLSSCESHGVTAHFAVSFHAAAQAAWWQLRDVPVVQCLRAASIMPSLGSHCARASQCSGSCTAGPACTFQRMDSIKHRVRYALLQPTRRETKKPRNLALQPHGADRPSCCHLGSLKHRQAHKGFTLSFDAFVKLSVHEVKASTKIHQSCWPALKYIVPDHTLTVQSGDTRVSDAAVDGSRGRSICS